MGQNREGYILYRNDLTGQTSYDHPTFRLIMSKLNDQFSVFKYTVYRCAIKIDFLKKEFYTRHIPYKTALSIMDYHIKGADSTFKVRPDKLTAIIHNIFFAWSRTTIVPENFNIDDATDILANFFWNVFDPKRSVTISVSNIKVLFLVICKVQCLDQMILEFFELGANHNRCISRFSFEMLLTSLAKIFTYIGESDAYGLQIIPQIINQCYSQCPGFNGLNQYQFMSFWQTSKTTIIIYSNILALINRIYFTKNLVHNTSCFSCGIEKIIGIKFKCQVCRKLSLCLKCFTHGFSNRKHTSSHRMYEVYAEEEAPSKKFSSFFSKFCTFLCKSENLESYEIQKPSHKLSELSSAVNSNRDITVKSTGNSIKLPKSEINGKLCQAIVCLENEKSKIDSLLKSQSKSSEDLENMYKFLMEHRQSLTSIIHDLNVFKQSFYKSFPVSSTPYKINFNHPPSRVTSYLSHSINGADVNKSNLEANKSDYSLSDVSTWFQYNISNIDEHRTNLSNILQEKSLDTEMMNFRQLLSKVKDIIDDSYSDNCKLAEATYRLETALDKIIHREEKKRALT